MKIRKKLCSKVVASTTVFLLLILISSMALASTIQDSSSNGPYAYITSGSNTVYVIDTSTNNITATVPIGTYTYPDGVTVTPDGKKVYVTNYNSSSVSVIDTANNTVTATVSIGFYPNGVAVTPDGKKVYVANADNTGIVSVIDTATNTVTSTVSVGSYPHGVAITPDGTKVYVTNYGSNSVSVINTANNTVTATVSIGSYPHGVTVTPGGEEVYVTNYNNGGIVSVIDTVTNEVTATVPVKSYPIAWGQFIGSVLPIVNFTANTTEGMTPLTVKFTDKSINRPTGWKWNFGDNQTSTVQNPEHIFSGVGVYTVTLAATNSDGSSGVKSMNITVNRVLIVPIANFTAKQTGPLKVKFNDKSSNSPNKWEWEFGDGSTSATTNPTHAYAAAGTYVVNLTVSNADGTDAASKTITVIGITNSPKASFTATPTFGHAPLTVKFTDTSVNADSIKWNFGDGTTSTDANPSHTYRTRGFYTMKLTAINGDKSSTVSKVIYAAR